MKWNAMRISVLDHPARIDPGIGRSPGGLPLTETAFGQQHPPSESPLVQLCGLLDVDELVVPATIHSHRARLRSYELLAKAFDLSPRR